jgi:TolB protein
MNIARKGTMIGLKPPKQSARMIGYGRTSAVIALASFVLVACGGEDEPASDQSSSQSSSPDGLPSAEVPSGLSGRLVFTRFDEATHTPISSHIVQPDGSNETQLDLPNSQAGGSWSPQGDRLAVEAELPDGRIGTAIIEPDGTLIRTLRIPHPSLNLVCFIWSPDGKRLACEGWNDSRPALRGIYTVRSSDGGDLTRATRSPTGKADLPGDFSSDGKQLVFKRTTEEDDGPLMLEGVAGGKPRRLSPGVFEDDGKFSPDGRSVLTSQGGSIILVGVDGEVRSRISKPGTYAFGAVWSPDGEWIAFSRGKHGPADIFISRPDGSEEFQVTDTPDNEINLGWGAD